MLLKLAIWYLRFKKVSVLINYHLEGGKAQQFSLKGLTYDCHFDKVDFRLADGTSFDIPEGSFQIERPYKVQQTI